MKKFKIIKAIKNTMLIIACLTFLLAAISVETAELGLIVLLAIIAVSTTAVGAFLERMIVLYYKNVQYTPIFTFNQHVNNKNEVIRKYHSWLKTNYAEDTQDNFDYFYNKYIA